MTREEREAIKRAQQERRKNSIQSAPRDEGNSVDTLLKELNELKIETALTVEKPSVPATITNQKPIEKPSENTPTSIENTDSTEEPTKVVSKPVSKSTKSKEEPTMLINIHFLDETDRAFFKVAPKLKNLKISGTYLIKLVDEDEKKTFDVTDELHQHLCSLKKKDFYDQTSTTIPVSYKSKITIQAAHHRMNDTQYMAYLIHKARLKTPGWS
jgi:hypothetical protein